MILRSSLRLQIASLCVMTNTCRILRTYGIWRQGRLAGKPASLARAGLASPLEVLNALN